MEEKFDCRNYKSSEKEINRNFFFVNAHGLELEQLYKIPEGVRIIMFCHEKTLNICKKFDRFNWEHILLNSTASNNYCSFLSTISQYSSIKDHFCVYEPGSTIRNISIHGDEYFRNGIYRLPVKGYAYNADECSVVVSDGTLIGEINSDPVLKKMIKNCDRTRIYVNSRKISELLREQNDVGIIKSDVIGIHHGSEKFLSNLIKSMKIHQPEFTILLMTCRNRDEDKIKSTKGIANNIDPAKRVSEAYTEMVKSED
jgi:hypothetical protein